MVGKIRQRQMEQRREQKERETAAAETIQQLRGSFEAQLEALQSAKDAEMEAIREVNRLKRLVSETIENKSLVTHEQQFKARQMLYYETLKRGSVLTAQVAREGRLAAPSLTWRSQREQPPLAPAHTLRPPRGRFWEQQSTIGVRMGARGHK